jgi:hypothetical protein
MQQIMINHPRLRATVRTGNEGPSHDPYSYEEYTVETPQGKTVLRSGLGTVLTFNDIEVSLADYSFEDQGKLVRGSLFFMQTGWTLQQIRRIARKAKERCRKCGGRKTVTDSGYPGETFECCAKCGNVMDTFFCSSAIE